MMYTKMTLNTLIDIEVKEVLTSSWPRLNFSLLYIEFNPFLLRSTNEKSNQGWNTSNLWKLQKLKYFEYGRKLGRSQCTLQEILNPKRLPQCINLLIKYWSTWHSKKSQHQEKKFRNFWWSCAIYLRNVYEHVGKKPTNKTWMMRK